MKRRRMMQRLVRLAVGSLCLLTLMVQAAPAATSTSMNVCAYPGVTSDGKTSTYRAVLFNPNGGSLTYQVGLVIKGSTPKLAPVTLAGNETRTLTEKDISPSGVTDATLLVETPDPGFVAANVFSSIAGVETAVPAAPALCYTLTSAQ